MTGRTDVLRLQLRDVNNAENVPSLQTVAGEFATRYLETLGVSPSRQTLDMVHTCIPLSDKNVTTTLRAKGHVNDELQIGVPSVAHRFRVPKVIQTPDVLQLGITNREVASQGAGAAGAAPPDQSKPAARSSVGSGGVAGAQFRQMASRYLYPFNLEVNLARVPLDELLKTSSQTRPRLHETVVVSTGQGWDEDGQPWPPSQLHSKAAVAPTASAGSPATSATPQPWAGLAAGLVHSHPRLWHVLNKHLAAAEQKLPDTGAGLRDALKPPRSSSGSCASPTALLTARVPHPGAPSPSRRSSAAYEPSPSGAWDPALMRQEVCEELLQDVTCTPEVVLMLVAQVEAALLDWHHHQAPETLKGSLTDDEFRATLELLIEDATVAWLVTLINFLHQEHVKGAPSYPCHLAEERASTAMFGRCSSRNMTRSLSRSVSLSSIRPGASSAATPRSQLLAQHDLGFQLWMQRRKRSPGTCSPNASRVSHAPTGRMAQGVTPAPSEPHPMTRTSQRLSKEGGQASRASPVACKAPCPQAGGQALASRSQRLPSAVSFAAANNRANGGANAELAGLPPSLMCCDDAPSPVVQSGRRSGRSGSGGTAAGPAAAAQSAAPTPTMQALLGRRSCMPTPSLLRGLPAAADDSSDIPPSVTRQDEQPIQQARLYALQKEFALLFCSLRRTRAGMFFQLPLLLVTARLVVSLLFNTTYRIWSQTREGQDALQQMDATIEHLFDPHGLIQRNLSILQSSPAAVDVSARHPHKSHEPERLHFADVSPLMQAILTDPASPAARKLLHQSQADRRTRARRAAHGHAKPGVGAAAPLRTQLTQEQKEQLFVEMQGLLKGCAAP